MGLMKRYTSILVLLFAFNLNAQITINVKDFYLKGRTKKLKNADFEIKRSNDSLIIVVPPIRDYHKNWLLIDFYSLPLEGANHIVPANSFVDSEYVYEKSDLFSKKSIQELSKIGNWAPVAIYKRFVSNKDYKCFLKYVQDSTALKTAGFILDSGEYYEQLDWSKLEDVISYKRKFDYEYWWIDYDAPKKKRRISTLRDSSESLNFIKKEVVNIYPDTNCWDLVLSDSLSQFFRKHYFQDRYFDDYPVFGVTPEQINAYMVWLTNQVKMYCDRKSKPCFYDYRIGNYINLMMIPNKYTLGNSVKIELDNHFYEMYQNDFNLRIKPSKVEVEFPSKPFRIVKTNIRMKIY